MRANWLISTALVMIPAGISAAEPARRPLIAPPEEWVIDAPIPPAPPVAEGAATVSLLNDTQIRLSDKGDTVFSADIYKIATAQGLDEASLQLTWDPSLEVLTIHRYRLWRDGRVIDLLGDGPDRGKGITVMQREKNMESAALDGELTASMQPDGVRVGDIVDLAYTITRHDPATGGRSQLMVGPPNGVPIGRLRLRAIWPATRATQWRAWPGAVQPVLTEKGGMKELVADMANVTTARPPSKAPSRFRAVNLVELTDFADWQTVSRTYADLFDKAAALSPTSPVRAEAAKIAAATSDPRKRAEMALQLVEQQVRYLFIGIDDGGFVPAPVDLTWQRRFGDCKGKTALLLALLRELGVSARPVLVNTDAGDFTANRLPTMAAFDHVIAEAVIDGRSYWLDGTRIGDTRLDRLRTPDYVVGLPATAQGSGFVPMVPEALTEPTQIASLDLDAGAGIEAPAPAKAEIRYRGETAHAMRERYNGLSAGDLERALKKLWRDTYDFITPVQVSAREEADKGEFVVSLKGTAKMDWYVEGASRWYELDHARVGWKFTTTREGEIQTDAPYAVDHPEWWANREVIHLPQGGKGFTLQATSDDTQVGGIYAFHRKVSLDGDTVQMENDTRSLKRELPAAEAESARDQLQKLANTGAFIRVPTDYFPTDADLAALKDNKPALAKAHMMRGAVLSDGDKHALSIAEERAALALDPKLTPARAILALNLAMTGEAGADAEAQTAIREDDKQWLAWSARAFVAARAGHQTEAITYADKALELNPRDLRSMMVRAGSRIDTGQYGAALADLDKALSMAPKLPVGMLRAAALASLGRQAEAMEQLNQTLETTPGDGRARLLRANLRRQMDDREGALEDLSWLIEHGPEVLHYLSRAGVWGPQDKARRDADLASALKLEPRNTKALLARAAYAIEDHQFEAAERDLSAADKISPGSSDVANLRMEWLGRQNRVEEALKIADGLIAAHADSATAYNSRCWLRATHGVGLDAALEDCNTALRLSPNAPAYLDSRAFVKFRQGDMKGAIGDYDAALRRAPTLVSSLYGRGLAYARLGDRNRALADIARARSIHPDVDALFNGYGTPAPKDF